MTGTDQAELLLTLEFALRAVVALLLGAAIGIERQWRSRMAGVRTNALVAGGSSLFVILGAYAFEADGADPTRVAAQIVSGIGFLGAGVIMREGINVRGLNTAATLWCTAAVGSLAGAGLYALAVVGATIIVVANTLLRPLTRWLTRIVRGHEPGPAVPYDAANHGDFRLSVSTTDKSEPRIRALILQALNRTEFQLRAVDTSAQSRGVVTVTAELTASPRAAGVSALERTVHRIGLDPKVSSVSWSELEDDE